MEYMGSSYKGDTENGRLEGIGTYTFPTKTYYTGQLKDGMFHGPGTLYFPDGNKFTGEWENGRVINGRYTFADGLTYEADQLKWQYCNKNDRRFFTEICNGLKPAGQSQMTDTRPAWCLPEDCYDCGDGFYQPDERIIRDYDMVFRRNADPDEHNWILYTCRKGWDEYSGETKAKKKTMLETIKYEKRK